MGDDQAKNPYDILMMAYDVMMIIIHNSYDGL